MSDRELLELAAKAAGYKIARSRLDDPLQRDMLLGEQGPLQECRFTGWNPLTNDGDALRLAVKLGLTICNEHESAGAVYCARAESEEFPTEYSGSVGDPLGITADDYAATRRAIVRAAAEIGRGMK